MKDQPVNAVIIGSGAGGGIVAQELAEAGWNVVVLERGRWQSPCEERKDDLRNQRVTALGPAYGPDESKCPRVFVDAKGVEQIVTPSHPGYNNNAACVGGGTVSYGAMAWRFMPQDFRMRSTYGPVAGSTLEDWPFSYDDLAPSYDKAEWELGVSGDVSTDPFKGPRAIGQSELRVRSFEPVSGIDLHRPDTFVTIPGVLYFRALRPSEDVENYFEPLEKQHHSLGWTCPAQRWVGFFASVTAADS